MTNKEIKQAVAGQIINMLDNNILREYGTEQFTGWLEDGEVFFNNGMSEADIEKAMEYARKVEDALDVINNVLGVEFDD
jgi:hypothetical protein